MKTMKCCLALVGLLGGLAAAQDMAVSVRPVSHGVILNAGSGDKKFLCVKGEVTHELNLSGRKVMTKGKFLTVTFDLEDQHLSMEAHDQVRPLLTNQVRMTCAKNDEVQVKVGSLVEVTDEE